MVRGTAGCHPLVPSYARPAWNCGFNAVSATEPNPHSSCAILHIGAANAGLSGARKLSSGHAIQRGQDSNAPAKLTVFHA